MMIEDEELRNLYQTSCEERLQKLEVGLRHLQAYPNDETTLDELRLLTHSIKGDSRSVGVEDVEPLALCIEEILSSLKRQQIVFTQQVSDRLFHGLDAISLLVQEAVTGEPSKIDLAGAIEQMMAAVLASKQPLQNVVLDAQDTQKIELGIPVQSAPILIADEELRNLYQTSCEERLQKLEAGLRHLQQYPDDETIWDELRLLAHSLTGDSSSVGIETVEILAHSLEETLESLKHQQIVLTQQVSDRLFHGLDAIALFVREAVTGEPSGVELTGVIEQLMAVVLESQEPPQEAVLDAQEQQQIAETRRFPPSQDASLRLEFELPPILDNGNASCTDALPGRLYPTLIEDEELREIYKLTSEERLQKLEAGLLHLEKHPQDEATLDELLREAHSLKGDSRSAGLDNVETLTHGLEDVLESLKRQQIVLTQQVSDRLYQGLDAISLLVCEAVTGTLSGVDTTGVLEQLMAAVAAPILPESATSTAEAPSLPAEIPVIATQELPSLPVGVGEPYHIDTIRVPTRELDALMTQAEELTVTKIAIAHATAEIEELAVLWEEWKALHSKGQSLKSSSPGTKSYQERLEKTINSLRTSARENSSKLDLIAGELREKIRTLRLLPLSTLFQLFPRMVRDLAKQQSKEVELIIEGGETTADKHILEEIKDALMHMVRNCVDHGIETPAEREKLGKPPVATIWLRGYHSSNNIVIEVADDGRGIDIEKIKQTAIKRKLYQKEELETMTPSQIHSLIFAPGFSTRTFITEISGRGIGLDVVRTNVERLKGTIQVESTPGQGSTFRLQLGTTLTSLNALVLEVQGIIHALPIEFVQTSLLVSQNMISTFEGHETITWDGQTIPVVNLANLLELSNSPIYASTANVEQHKNDMRPCILLKVGEEQAGFFVDRLLDTQEVVLKPQSQVLKRVRHVTGATILPTGNVCMILNPPDLLKSLQQQTPSVVSIKPRETIQRKPVILLVEDSIPVRTQEQRLLEKAGYEVVIAVDGLDGYNSLKSRDFDAVISDVEMPNLDGLSLTAKIRQHPEYNELPIILVTTLDSDEDKRKGADAGADAYIIKGKFNQEFLLETLAKLV